MSQLLCEQVVGRGLRRASYDVEEIGYRAMFAPGGANAREIVTTRMRQ